MATCREKRSWAWQVLAILKGVHGYPLKNALVCQPVTLTEPHRLLFIELLLLQHELSILTFYHQKISKLHDFEQVHISWIAGGPWAPNFSNVFLGTAQLHPLYAQWIILYSKY